MTTMKVTTMDYNDEGWLDIEGEVILEIPNQIYDRYSNCYIITANIPYGFGLDCRHAQP